MDEVSLQRDVSRAARAQALIENDLLNEAFEALEESYFDAWRNSPSDGKDARERLWAACSVVTFVRKHLDTIIMNGQIAKADLEQIRATPSAYRA